METPCVVVNVQRGGPSTGLPTMVGQADMMQARWGSHGDYELIALCPQSPQEAFDFTIDAFNLAETYRVPVLVMMDECVGHMTEKVVIPPAEEIEIVPRKLTEQAPGRVPALRDQRPPGPGVRPGRGRLPVPHHRPDPRRARLPGDERRVPGEVASRRLIDKIRDNADEIIRFEEDETEGAEVVVVRLRHHRAGGPHGRSTWPGRRGSRSATSG